MATQYIDDKGSKKVTLPPLTAIAEVEELIGNVPSWIVRWGITVIFFIISAFVTLSWFIHYPDIVEAKGKLTTEKPPIRVVALSSGKISQLVIDKQSVDSGKVLAILENPAKFEDVLKLETWLVQTPKDSLMNLEPLPDGLEVGVLQSSYTSFLQQFADFKYYMENNGVASKKNNLQKRISDLENLKLNYVKQKPNFQKEVDIANRNVTRVSLLAKQGVSSEVEKENAEVALAQAQIKLKDLQTKIISTDNEKRPLEGQILESSQSLNDNENNKQLIVKKLLTSLHSEIQKWKQDFLLIAPISGQVAFSKNWSSQQNVSAQDEVMTIVPQISAYNNKIVCQVALDIDGAGKVKVGQIVNIRLTSFPYRQYGSLEATIKSIAAVPTASGLPVEIELNKAVLQGKESFLTTFKKRIPFSQEMACTASIITEDQRICYRIFDKILSVVKK